MFRGVAGSAAFRPQKRALVGGRLDHTIPAVAFCGVTAALRAWLRRPCVLDFGIRVHRGSENRFRPNQSSAIETICRITLATVAVISPGR